MFTQLLRDFRTNTRAGIALMTAGLMPLIMVMMFTANDFGRYYMYSRYFSSAAQQAEEWMMQKAITSSTYDKTTAKTYFDSLINSAGITSDSVTFVYNKASNKGRLVAKGKYNLFVSKILNIGPLPLVAEAGSYHPPKPSLFISIVFSSGEMRSEGDTAYGKGQTGSNAPNRGVSSSNPYVTSANGQTISPRTTPTHNYYMVTALVKELIKNNQDKTLYINMIPVSATVNLNPNDYTVALTGSKEGKLPPWISNYGSIDTTKPLCVTNRGIDNPKKYEGVPTNPNITDYSVDLMQMAHDSYRINPAELNSTLVFNSNNWFTPDDVLYDSTIPYYYAESVRLKSHNVAQQDYVYQSLSIGGQCPAINGTPALATFQKVTSTDYPSIDTTLKVGVTENEIFWDYMRNYIDPDKAKSFAVWGSPNIAFGLQVAYENIAYVQNAKQINLNDTGLTFDIYNSQFQVFVVSDQIGGVKNAAGAATITTSTEYNRNPDYNNCVHQLNATTTHDPACMPAYDYFKSYPFNFLSTPLYFTHMWWDSAYNYSSQACFANNMTGTQSCDAQYAATPARVVHHFYNIINYAIDLKYNKDGKKNFIRPSAYFIDTGSGKISDECQSSNANQDFIYLFTGSYNQDNFKKVTDLATATAKHYTTSKPCMAYAEMAGYDTNYGIADASTEKEGGIITMTMSAGNSGFPLSAYGDMIDRYAVADVSASGFNRVFTYKYKQESTVTTRNLDTYAANFLPVYYYNTTDKLQIRSNSNDKSIYDSTVNIATNAKSIAQLIIKHLNDGPTITRPY